MTNAGWLSTTAGKHGIYRSGNAASEASVDADTLKKFWKNIEEKYSTGKWRVVLTKAARDELASFDRPVQELIKATLLKGAEFENLLPRLRRFEGAIDAFGLEIKEENTSVLISFVPMFARKDLIVVAFVELESSEATADQGAIDRSLKVREKLFAKRLNSYIHSDPTEQIEFSVE